MSKIYCDLDGTLIEGDLEREFIRYLQSMNHFTIWNYFLAMISLPTNWIRRQKNYGSKYKSWTFGKNEEERKLLYSEFFSKCPNCIRFRVNVLELLKKYKDDNNKIILMTGSYIELVRFFLERENVTPLFDEVIACEVKKNGFCISQHPYGKDKCIFLDLSEPIIGIANEYADRFYLELCSEAYVVGEDKKLKEVAYKNNWRYL